MPTKTKPVEADSRQLKMVDIARMAGVDVSTVSRALANSPRVTRETKNRIAEIVRDTGYVVNRSARTLRAGRANQILVIIPDIAATFYPEVVKGIEEVMFTRRINVLLGSTMRDAEREAELGKHLLTGTVDGILTITGCLPEGVMAMPDFNRRVVAVSRPVRGVTKVGIDDYAAASQMMQYLYDCGHRNITHIGGPASSEVFQERVRGYLDFMKSHGLEHYVQVRRANTFGISSGQQLAAITLSASNPSPTALFCASDDLALGAMVATRKVGLQIPQDISVAGFDDLKVGSLVQPGLTTVSVPRIEMGRRGAELLYAMVYRGVSEKDDVTLPHKIVVRESVAGN